MLLDQQVAIVTGTGPNIGSEIARTLAAHGAAVVCVDAREDQARIAAEGIVAAGGRAIAACADVTDGADVEVVFDRAVDTFGGVHILVNNAAITHTGTILDTTPDEWRRVLDVTLTGAFLCGQHAARHMVDQGTGGAIVNICSTSGHRGGVRAIAYATAKGGILNLTRSMAIQLAEHGIRVNSITPTQTGIPIGADKPRDESGPPNNIPLGRWGRPTDQAQAVLFLVSPSAAFITGVDLPVDGGLLAGIAKG
jgi:NAD(P)-dependent dehydrogenase (short-subunit alcohol dehydrogenase family)